jgi:DNA-directed RNA polymerase specialized sigma24 family protein
MTAAAKRGRSVEEIASTEQVSEGEVRLRLHLAKQAAQAKATRTRRGRADAPQTQESTNGALRA